ncbi:NADPH-dependent F420 reductase [Streptosporangium sp. 'caverna']|uniref:NADPH-dependent F420 reductase n=1 Tax=Streptosporangium sp. 'caverna' TaxID=2202249 RepID=UPI000D7E5D9A|nr:NAD(P)-binding domain-containing protein [Streptosporangium sp. 'caverna']AWS46283.1 NADP oxidoreductase [Streptosporangium sp. 'caverna']
MRIETFGVIGAGAIAQAVARHALNVGHKVTLSNSRGPETLEPLIHELGPGASAGTIAEAAQADAVLLAVPWPHIPQALSGLPPWDGRILIDATNHFLTGPPEFEVADLGGQTGSEVVAGLAPGAHVIKAFNTLYAQHIAADPRHEAGRRVLFLAGDDAAAAAAFAEWADGLGFAPVNVGDLRTGGRLMQLGGSLSSLHLLKQG